MRCSSSLSGTAPSSRRNLASTTRSPERSGASPPGERRLRPGAWNGPFPSLPVPPPTWAPLLGPRALDLDPLVAYQGGGAHGRVAKPVAHLVHRPGGLGPGGLVGLVQGERA